MCRGSILCWDNEESEKMEMIMIMKESFRSLLVRIRDHGRNGWSRLRITLLDTQSATTMSVVEWISVWKSPVQALANLSFNTMKSFSPEFLMPFCVNTNAKTVSYQTQINPKIKVSISSLSVSNLIIQGIRMLLSSSRYSFFNDCPQKDRIFLPR